MKLAYLSQDLAVVVRKQTLTGLSGGWWKGVPVLSFAPLPNTDTRPAWIRRHTLSGHPKHRPHTNKRTSAAEKLESMLVKPGLRTWGFKDISYKVFFCGLASHHAGEVTEVGRTHLANVEQRVTTKRCKPRKKNFLGHFLAYVWRHLTEKLKYHNKINFSQNI